VPYKLGDEGGPFTPNAADPPAAGLDCSRFVLWALRHAHGPMDTTMIVDDATGSKEFFSLRAAAQPGCLIVYPDYEAIVMGEKIQHDGHVGIVTAAAAGKATSVIHCSRIVEGLHSALIPGTAPDSIVESGPLWFPAFHAIHVWYKTLTEA
jgi:cell wall-associated NlpC family hydrolase